MKKIYKFTLLIADGPQYLQMPIGAEIIHVGLQGHLIAFWALIDLANRFETTAYLIFGTDQEIPPHLEASDHVATVLQYDGALVWHVFNDRSPILKEKP